MARDPGHGDLAFLHSSVFHFLSSLLLHTSIYLTISRIAFISLLLFRDLSLVLSSLAPLAPGHLLKIATAIRYLVIEYEKKVVLLAVDREVSTPLDSLAPLNTEKCCCVMPTTTGSQCSLG